MKVSFLTHVCLEWELDQVIESAARNRYHGIEWRIDCGNRHGLEVTASAAQRAEARRRIAAAGLETACVSTSLHCSQPEFLSDAPERIRLAADLGSPGLRVFCGGQVGAGKTTADLVAQAGANLARLAPVAAAAGVGLWLETHDTCCTARDTVAAVRLAGHPAVGVNWDILHPIRRGEALVTTLELLKGLVRHTHWHDSAWDGDQLSIVRFGQGNLPLARILAGLRALGYEGYIGGEFFPGNLAPTAEESIAVFRREVAELTAPG